MPKFAPVMPLSLAGQLSQGELGDYHLLLAHDVVDNPAEYQEVYGHLRAKEGKPGSCIILDNSLVELGHPAPIDMLVEACIVMEPHYLVMPDYLKCSEETYQASLRFMLKWKQEVGRRPFLKSIGLVGVIQAETPERCWRTIGLYKNHKDVVRMVSVPRVMVEQFGSRIHIIEDLRNFFGRSVPIHLLGFSDDVLDDVCAARIPGVIGIDSAVPVRLGLQGKIMDLSVVQDPGPRGKYWDDPLSTMPYARLGWKSYVTTNLLRIRKWIDTSKMLWQHVRPEHVQD